MAAAEGPRRTSAGNTLTPLGLAIIGLLLERAMHPYEMYQWLITRREDRLVKVRPGSLYHTVDRLAERDLVRAVGTDRAGNRPERTVYEVTSTGRKAFNDRIIDILRAPAAEFPIFPVGIAEAHNLEADLVVKLLAERSEALDRQLIELQVMKKYAEEHEVPRMYWLTVGYQTEMLRTELRWITELSAQISSGALRWTAFPPADTPASVPKR
ncbi:PadR family transcriptional regulator [Skermania sp. ID1734]|uniref:PadR family transcriptional regulator n=1 Tax=Skermania sp. ID1734 TaxID=2597516 RepID=UPI0011809701|nr:PadR family transcriptional regulator [Skermania sp. ID1734]TSE01875.1 PadR family transcriptional regulator [Skermania sp. ID1734]